MEDGDEITDGRKPIKVSAMKVMKKANGGSNDSDAEDDGQDD